MSIESASQVPTYLTFAVFVSDWEPVCILISDILQAELQEAHNNNLGLFGDINSYLTKFGCAPFRLTSELNGALPCVSVSGL